MLRKLTLFGLPLLLLLFLLWWRIPYSQNHAPAPTAPPSARVGESQLPTASAVPGLTVPDGFTISYFAEGVLGARSLARNPDGSLVFVGTRGTTLYALVDQNRDGVSEQTVVIRSDLDTPNGVAFWRGDLYVAELSRILKFPNIAETYAHNPSYEVLYDQLPKDKHHGWKYLAMGPDNLLYVPIGAPCNVCLDQDRYARLLTLNPETKEVKSFARGIRNTVGFDWSPVDQSLYFTDNGRDLLGDNTPPDELNHAPVTGLDFGFPFCHGTSVIDPVHGSPDSCKTSTPPVVELGPHVAALGVKFYRGAMFPPEYKHQLIIAEHGSWNRRDPIGYRLTLVNPETKSYEPFVTGWLQAGESWGRPVDILELPDGSVLISDDLNNSLYRLSYLPP